MMEALFDPYYRSRFLGLLRTSRAHLGIMAFPQFKEPVGAREEDVVDRVLKHVAEVIRMNLGTDQALVAIFRDTAGTAYVVGSSRDMTGGDLPLTAALGATVARATSDPSQVSSEVDLAIDRSPETRGIQGTVLAAALRVEEAVCGVVMAAKQGSRESLAAERTTLGLVAVLIGNAIGQVTNEITDEERLRSLVHSLSAALDARDPNSRGHSDRVAMYAMAIVNEMKYDENDLLYQEARSRIRLAALLHDIGKIGIPDRILLKPDKLSEEEYESIKQHSIMGAEIVTACEGLKDLVPGVLYHHENFDGSGYPFGLAGERIPLLARVIALADAFDAITSDRPFHRASSQDQALEIMRHQVAHRYDPSLLEALVQANEKGMLKHVRLPAKARRDAKVSDDDVEKMYGGQLGTIPSLPSALATLNSLLDDPDAALRDVARVLSSDQGVASRVLKLVNSAYYGLPQMVATIPLAATLLGAKAIKHHVVNIALADLLNSLGGGHGDYEILWKHALRTSSWAKAIASIVPGADPEEAFTAGLVHDIGKALALRLRPGDYGKVVREAHKTGKPLTGVEEQVIGFDHTRIGGWAATKWMLPQILVNCIRWHHEPDVVSRDSAGVSEMVLIVHIADIVACNSDRQGQALMACLAEEANPEALRVLGDGLADHLEGIRAAVEAEEEALEETFSPAVTV